MIRLSNREAQVLAGIARGLPNKEIAAELGIATKTVMVHVGRVLEKTGARNRTEAAVLTLRGRDV